MTATPHHVGICVADLDRSLRFWCDGLGFESVTVLPLGSEWSRALEVDGEADVTAHFIRKGAFEFELLHYRSPEPHGTPASSRAHLGFTHLALYVDDLDTTLSHLAACGGTILEHTRTKFGDGEAAGELCFVADPDGVRVEIAQVRA